MSVPKDTASDMVGACDFFFLLLCRYVFSRLRLRSCPLASVLTNSRLQSRLRPRNLPISQDKSRPEPLIVGGVEGRREGGRRGCRMARAGGGGGWGLGGR